MGPPTRINVIKIIPIEICRDLFLRPFQILSSQQWTTITVMGLCEKEFQTSSGPTCFCTEQVRCSCTCFTEDEFHLWLLRGSQASVLESPKRDSIRHFSKNREFLSGFEMSYVSLQPLWTKFCPHTETDVTGPQFLMRTPLPSPVLHYRPERPELRGHLSISRFWYNQRELPKAAVYGNFLPLSHRTQAHSLPVGEQWKPERATLFCFVCKHF